MRVTPLLSISLVLVSAAATGASPGVSPYAGQQHHAIKALSPQDTSGLLAGAGAGYAKAAELNGYPGPAHVLELADALQLTPEQRAATASLLESHKARARTLGAEIVEAERRLDQLFAARQASPERLRAEVEAIATLQGRLRNEHLTTHLEQTALLNAQQVQRYAELRGYTATAADEPRASGHRHAH